MRRHRQTTGRQEHTVADAQTSSLRDLCAQRSLRVSLLITTWQSDINSANSRAPARFRYARNSSTTNCCSTCLSIPRARAQLARGWQICAPPIAHTGAGTRRQRTCGALMPAPWMAFAMSFTSCAPDRAPGLVRRRHGNRRATRAPGARTDQALALHIQYCIRTPHTVLVEVRRLGVRLNLAHRGPFSVQELINPCARRCGAW